MDVLEQLAAREPAAERPDGSYTCGARTSWPGSTNSSNIFYQSWLPSNWFEFSGVMPLLSSSCPSGDSVLILPDMNG
eukprot:COSAG01_NODE_937_length_12628_cov_12.665257_18_plen_77_part_00